VWRKDAVRVPVSVSMQLSQNLASLPPAFKYQILSFLEPDLVEKTLVTTPQEKLPGFPFRESLVKKEALAFFSEADLAALDREGYFIRDNFLGDKEKVLSVWNEAEQLKTQGKLQPAGMSSGENKWHEKKVRGDLRLWMNDRTSLSSLCPDICELIDRAQRLQQELNEACNFDSKRTQVQLACYPGGGSRYVRHLDAFKGGASRRLTILYYFNHDWREGDGGELCLYVDEESVKVQPISDRLVVFQSRQLEHEVLAANTTRYALTVWLY